LWLPNATEGATAAPEKITWAGIRRLPTFGKDSYFWLVVLVVVVGLVFLVLCFLAFFAGAVVLWLVDWPLAGAFCAAKIGRAAAAKTIASKLFFMLILLEGIYLSRQFHLPAEPL
jgi:hypothetical protein